MSIAALPGQQRQLGPPPRAGAHSGPGLAPDQLLVLAALAAAAVGHGGYYRRASELCAILLGLAAATTLSRRRLSGVRPVWPALAGMGALAAATAVTAGLDGRVAGATGPVALIIGLAVVTVVGAGSSPSERRTMADAILALGAFLALSGWIGVVFRLNGLAQLADGLWRAATTITYSNAAAALLAMLALWALARAVTRKGRTGAVAAVLIIGGMGATLSRAGLAGFAVGLIVLAWLIGVRRLIRGALPLLLGGALVTAGLAVGMVAGDPSRPVWAVLGLVAGIAVAVVRWPRAAPRYPARVVVLVTAVVVGAAALGVGELAAHSPRWSARLSLSSPSRTSVASAAWHTWSDHRLTGVGPGPIVFIWTTPGQQTLIDHYAHDEYLQLAAQEGVVGLLGLAALIVGVAATLRNGWRSRPRRTGKPIEDLFVLRAGALAGLVAFTVHSGFDFLWHVPVVPLIAGISVGLGAALPAPGKMFHQHPQRQTQEVQ